MGHLKSLGWDRETDIRDLSSVVEKCPNLMDILLDEFEVVALDSQEGDDVSEETMNALLKSL